MTKGLKLGTIAGELLVAAALAKPLWEMTAPEFPESAITAEKVGTIVDLQEEGREVCEVGGQKGLDDAKETWVPHRHQVIEGLGLQDESAFVCRRDTWTENSFHGHMNVSERGILTPSWMLTGFNQGTAVFQSSAFLRPSTRHEVVYDPTQASFAQRAEVLLPQE